MNEDKPTADATFDRTAEPGQRIAAEPEPNQQVEATIRSIVNLFCGITGYVPDQRVKSCADGRSKPNTNNHTEGQTLSCR